MTAPFRIMELGREHNRVNFRCGEPALDKYLHMYAGQDVKRGLSKVFVTVAPGSNDVLGFYSLSAYSTALADLPLEIRRNLPERGTVPAVLLGRLAVHKSAQGKRCGGFLLQDALQRALDANLGWAIFLVHAKNEYVAAFYRHFEFQPLDPASTALYITRKTASAVCSLPN